MFLPPDLGAARLLLHLPWPISRLYQSTFLQATYPNSKIASTTIDVLDYIVWLVSSCLTLTPTKLKNPAFAMALSTLDVLERLLSDSLLIFALVLLNVVQASTPPSMSYFRNLPTDVRKCWAVYLLVLKKPGCRPKFYVRSGTNGVCGAAKTVPGLRQPDNSTYIHQAGFKR